MIGLSGEAQLIRLSAQRAANQQPDNNVTLQQATNKGKKKTVDKGKGLKTQTHVHMDTHLKLVSHLTPGERMTEWKNIFLLQNDHL